MNMVNHAQPVKLVSSNITTSKNVANFSYGGEGTGLFYSGYGVDVSGTVTEAGHNKNSFEKREHFTRTDTAATSEPLLISFTPWTVDDSSYKKVSRDELVSYGYTGSGEANEWLEFASVGDTSLIDGQTTIDIDVSANGQYQIGAAMGTITASGAAIGDLIGTHGARTWYDPAGEFDAIQDALTEAYIAARSTISAIASDPSGVAAAAADQIFEYFDQLTLDPNVSGAALGNGTISWATIGVGGGALNATKSIGTALHGAATAAKAVDKIEDAADLVGDVAKVAPKGGDKIFRVYGGDSKPGGASWTPVDPRNVRISEMLRDFHLVEQVA
jgi:hypothetical protein